MRLRFGGEVIRGLFSEFYGIHVREATLTKAMASPSKLLPNCVYIPRNLFNVILERDFGYFKCRQFSFNDKSWFTDSVFCMTPFILESDNEGQLFLSTTDDPDQKILICRVGKGHESLPMEFYK